MDSKKGFIECNSKFKSLFKNAKEGIVYLDKKGIITEANPRVLLMAGCEPEDILNKHFTQLAPMFKLNRIQMLDVFKQLITSKKLGKSEWEITNLKGEKKVLLAHPSLIRGKNSDYEVSVIVEDITDIKKTCIRLCENELKYRNFFKTCGDCVFITSKDGRWIDMNDAAADFFGYESREELAKTRIPDLYLNKEDRIRHMEKIEEKGYLKEHPVKLKKKDGTVMDTLITTVPVTDENGAVVAFQGTIRDITKHKKIEDELKRYLHNLEFLSDTALHFMKMPPREDIYNYVGEKLTQIEENSIILVSSYDKKSGEMIVRSIQGLKRVKLVEKNIGFSPLGFRFKVNDTGRDYLVKGNLHRVPEGLYELMFHKTPEKVCIALERLFKIECIYSMGFAWGGELFGAIVIIKFGGCELKNEELIKTFINQASVAIQHKKAAQSLKESELEKNILLDNMLEHVVYRDTDMRIQWANNAACESVGLSPDKVIGRYCYEIWQNRDRPCEPCPVKEALKEGKPKKMEVSGPDGRVWSIQAYPIHGADGSIVGVGNTSLDITGRKKAEQELQESKQIMSIVLNSTTELFAFYTTDLKIIWANKAASDSVGLSLDEMIGQYCYKLWGDGQQPCPDCPVMKSLETGKPPMMEKQTPDGRWWSVRGYPVFDEGGEITNLVEFVQDITERKKNEDELKAAYAKLRQLDDLKDEFVNISAHELKTPLVPIMGYIELVLEDNKIDEEQKNMLQIAYRAARRQEKLVSDILDISKLESGAMKFETKEMDLVKLVNTAVAEMKTVAEEKNIKLVTKLPDEPLMINADPYRLDQVISNLLDNSLK
ncbi:MAG: hypothetical protein B6U97_05060 [Candidatus Altiarchaeales archaeon ex4484_96]|nr:MAG: hypothetical protein B6U97_05060 [Candidatus Altiarchaeales archaeon ex4484_96]